VVNCPGVNFLELEDCARYDMTSYLLQSTTVWLLCTLLTIIQLVIMMQTLTPQSDRLEEIEIDSPSLKRLMLASCTNLKHVAVLSSMLQTIVVHYSVVQLVMELISRNVGLTNLTVVDPAKLSNEQLAALRAIVSHHCQTNLGQPAQQHWY
jgi:hypothetical protein